MKLTKTNLKNMEGQSNLKDYVLDYIIDKWDNYDDKKAIFTDALEHGCISGMVGSLIYYSDTIAFYEEHKGEINTLLYETIQGIGDSMFDVFGDKLDREDPLCLETTNQNLLAWFGFEETLRNIAREFEDLEDYC